jgi:hypothetical protein
MRVPKGKRIMKNRRQFLVDNVAAWFLAPDLARRIEWVSQHEQRPLLPDIQTPTESLFADFDNGRFTLSLDVRAFHDKLHHLTWEEYFDDQGIGIDDTEAILDWASDKGWHEPDEGEVFNIPHPDDPIDDGLFEELLEWGWSLNDSGTSRAYHYLNELNLCPQKPTSGDALGHLELVQGDHPGSHSTFAFAHCNQTLSCLQHRLLELGEKVKIIVS